ncbi:hypothetical protein HK104_003015, partial [Borealophlyctis nickersoniae]
MSKSTRDLLITLHSITFSTQAHHFITISSSIDSPSNDTPVRRTDVSQPVSTPEFIKRRFRIPVPDDMFAVDGGGGGGNVRIDLSAWQIHDQGDGEEGFAVFVGSAGLDVDVRKLGDELVRKAFDVV